MVSTPASYAEYLERQLALAMTLATLATETKGVAHFIARCQEQIVRAYNLSMAQYWTLDATQQTLQCSDVWFSLASVHEFRRASKERKYSKGVGLPGRVWGIGSPLFVPHLSMEMGTSFPRKEIALRAGLMSGFAFPVKNGPLLRGVLEFYSFVNIDENSADLLFFERLGNVIGGLIEEKQEQENTHRQEVIISAILKKCPMAMVAIDARGLVTHWSPRAQEIFGWSEEEAAGQQLGDLIIPERYREQHNQGLLKYLRTRSAILLDKVVYVPACHLDGREFVIEMKVSEFALPAEGFGFVAYLNVAGEADVPEMELK